MHNDTVIIIENHYLGSILNMQQFDTFYHEHPRTYSLNSFLKISETLNRKIISVEFPKRYGGNIRVMISNKDIESQVDYSTIIAEENNFEEKFKQMKDFILNWKESKRSELLDLVRVFGKLPAKAFPGRASILLNILELTDKEIECVYEKEGSLKIGNYIPGTNIPIVSDLELFSKIDNIKVIINFAWHIKPEIESYLKSHGYKGSIVSIL